ncbi:hypothetical protein GQ600_16517 [Phytophthora cactorum]|nr:hypothetical protein GQ600_16517 [Phytophthora cactorum]
MPIPDDHFASLRYCDKCTSNRCTADACIVSPAGTGVPNTDFLNYVQVEDTDDCRSSSTLAYASTCQQDQYDRPTLGWLTSVQKSSALRTRRLSVRFPQRFMNYYILSTSRRDSSR